MVGVYCVRRGLQNTFSEQSTTLIYPELICGIFNRLLMEITIYERYYVGRYRKSLLINTMIGDLIFFPNTK